MNEADYLQDAKDSLAEADEYLERSESGTNSNYHIGRAERALRMAEIQAHIAIAVELRRLAHGSHTE